MDTEKRLFGLMALAEENQVTVQDALARLDIEQDRLHKLSQAVAGQIRDETARTVRNEAGQAVRDAMAGLDQSSKVAKEVAAQLDHVATSLRWKVFAMVMAGVVAVGLVGLGILVYELDQVRKMQANLDVLASKGGRVHLDLCGDHRRLCVQIDKSAGAFNEDHYVIQGY